ncbi:MAG TPA: IS256 family transposase [Nitriliruptorales bacterium]
MQGSHTSTSARHDADHDRRLQLVSTADRGLPARLAGAIDGHLATFAEHVREGLLAASTAVGLEVMAEMMQAEVTELAGVKGRHDPDRSHTRHGTEGGSVTLGGRRLPVTRPRVRTIGDEPEEATLASYATFADTDLLSEQVTARMLAGISTRKYPVALEPVGEAVERQAMSTSKSAVSRRFVTATAERLAELCARPLDQARWPIVMLDGVHLGEHLLVVALGVTDDGTKVPLGVVEGSTENAEVCARLVADLVDRGLDVSGGILFVIDGGKALAKALRAAFGPKALIQRCRRHKERNVLGHLPEAERPLIQRTLRGAWANPDADAARRELEALARALDKKRPGAAASLREGLEHTLTVNRLGVTGSLLKTVESTNPVESMIEIVRHHARRVKRWQHGEMALRWTAAGMLAAQDQFRRVKGYRQLPALLTALAEATADQPATDVAYDVPAAVTA